MCKAFWQRINIFIWAICGIAEIAYRVTAEMEQLSQNESEEDGNMREMNYLTEKDLAYFEKRAEEGKAVILRIDPEELLSMNLEQAFQEEKEEPITEAEVRKWLEENDLLIGDKETDEPTQEDQVKPVEQVIKPEPIREEEGDTLAQRLQQIKLDDDQVQVLKKAIEAGLSEKEILSFLKPEFTAEKMYTIMELLKK